VRRHGRVRHRPQVPRLRLRLAAQGTTQTVRDPKAAKEQRSKVYWKGVGRHNIPNHPW
jgi:hypothetical protein